MIFSPSYQTLKGDSAIPTPFHMSLLSTISKSELGIRMISPVFSATVGPPGNSDSFNGFTGLDHINPMNKVDNGLLIRYLFCERLFKALVCS